MHNGQPILPVILNMEAFMENSNFSMTLTQCRQVLDTFDNLVVIDDRGYIRYLSPDMYFMIEAYNKNPVPGDVIGRHISDVHYVSKITNALETGRPMKTAFYFSSNVTNIARIEPVYRDGKLVGAIDYDLFTDGNKLRKFVDMAGKYVEGGHDGFESLYLDSDDSGQRMEYHNFDLSTEDCRSIFDTFVRLIITDEKGRIRYLSPDIDTPVSDACGMDITDVYPVSRIKEVLETGRVIQAEFYSHHGSLNITRIEPVISEGKITGAIEYTIIESRSDLKAFLEKVDEYTDVGILNFENTFESMYDSSKKNRSIKYTINNIIGDSKAMRKLRTEIANISENNATVLITGKTGSGKELVAHSIHNLSLRADKSIVSVNCAAIPDSLFESELFGYEEGSFTGAKRGGKKGYFEEADGGTLFLDEVDQLPYHVQPKLLRALQEKEITPVGGKTRDIDIRVIAATNKDLLKMAEEGLFREDLYYRLNVVEIHVPPLAERREDIPMLIDLQMKRLGRVLFKDIKGVSDDVMKAFFSYDWPGNVRELFNVLERGMINCRGDVLQFDDLGVFGAKLRPASFDLFLESDAPLEEVRNRAEEAAIRKVLEMTGGNRSLAAKMLKISRTSFYEKLNKLGIR